MSVDGSIIIDTKIDTDGFSQGIRKIQASIAGALNKILLPLIGIGETIKKVLTSAMAAAASAAQAVLGALFVAFALSVAKIFAFVREAVQDAITLSPTVSRQWEEIQNSFVELKHAIGNAFLPLIQVAIPYIKMALSWLIEVFNRISMITAALMGQKEALQIIQGSAQSIADANKKTEKAAKGQLAAFDQISVLQKPDTGTDAADLPKVAGELVPITDDILDKVKAIKDVIAEWFADPIGKLQETWGKIVDWFRANVLEPIVEWWNSTWLGQLLGQLWENFTNTWARIKENTLETFENIKERIRQFFEGVIQFAIGVFTGNWALAWEGIKNIVGGIFGLIWEIIKGGITNWLLLISGWVNQAKIVFETTLAPAIGKVLDWIKEKFFSIFTSVKDFVRNTIDGIIGYIANLIQTILDGIAMISGLNAPGAMGGAVGAAKLGRAQLPGLATGAVIPPNAQFAAILGDQRGHRNLEAPEPLIRQIFREELQGLGGEIKIDNNLYLDGELVHKNQKKISRRHGASLISGR